MADTTKGLYLEPDWIPALLAFAPSELGRLIRCALIYTTEGKASDLPGKERVLWPYIQSRIDLKGSAPHGTKNAPAAPSKKAETGGLGEALPKSGSGQNAPEPHENVPSPILYTSLSNTPVSSEKEKDCCKEKEAKKKKAVEKEKVWDLFDEFEYRHFNYEWGGDLSEALHAFEKHRKETKHPMSDEAKKRLLSKLEKFPKGEWIPILNQSILNGWQDIYPLKQENQPQIKKNAPTGSISRTVGTDGAAKLAALQAEMATWGGEKKSTTSESM